MFPNKILPLICYEAIFPNFVRNSITNDTNLIVNISNDGWFGNLVVQNSILYMRSLDQSSLVFLQLGPQIRDFQLVVQ